MDIESLRAKKQLLYYHNIMTNEEDTQLKRIITQPKNPWKKLVDQTLESIKVTETQLLNLNKRKAKTLINRNIKNSLRSKLLKAATIKSKVRDLVIYKTRKEIGEKPEYMMKLTRKQCSNIFNIRARMIKIKGNYKSQYPDMKCRWCQHPTETQTHILTECCGFKPITANIPYENYFKNNIEDTAAAANNLGKIIEKINSKNP